MPNMTLAVSEDLHKMMQKHREVKWSEVARQALWQHAKKVDLLYKLLSKSQLTEEDALDIGKRIKSSVAKRHEL